MILSCNNLEKSFDDNLIFANCSFVIEEREKAAIVGINGAGKSTLLKIIVKKLSSDKGSVFLAKDKTLGYLAQHQDIGGNNTIYDEMLDAKKDIIELESNIRSLELSMKTAKGDELDSLFSSYERLNNEFELKNGYSYKSEIVGVLKGLGFNENSFDKKITTLSGGQKTRIALGKLLLSKPDVLLLDEPTNHLDIASITWLESYLNNYSGAVIIVSHDRYFLDKIVTKIVEIDRTKVTVFSGNYSDYAKKKALLRESEIKLYVEQQRELKHHEGVIDKLKAFGGEKAIKRAKSREKILGKIDVLDKPITETEKMKIQLEPKFESGKDVLTVKELAKSFGDLTLFKNVSFDIKKGERVAIIGENGTGKTTILKIINNLINADGGEITLGAKVNIGYYDQEQQLLNMKNTIFEEISDAYPTLTITEIRNMLAAFLFTGDDVFKHISALSGGEKGRVSLAKLMLSESNFLILDEPTNHLDIDSKEILEDALLNYTGTVLYVSHDRYFINRTASRILDLENGIMVNYIGNYDYYIEKHEHLSSIAQRDNSNDIVVNEYQTSTSNADNKADWKTMKAEQAKERKRRNDIKKIEDEIADLEEKIEFFNEELTKEDISTSVSKCMEIHNEQSTLQSRLDILYDSWEQLM